MKTYTPALLAVAAMAGIAIPAGATDSDIRLRIALSSFQEVPAISSPGAGEFRARVDVANELIEYELTYDGTRGTVTQAHIHLGQRTANGGIAMWLCANNPPITAAPAGTQTCPVRGTITGVLVAKDVVGVAAQALPAAGIRDAIAAIRAGAMYVNVHTTTVPSGELRGQLDPRRGGGDHHHH